MPKWCAYVQESPRTQIVRTKETSGPARPKAHGHQGLSVHISLSGKSCPGGYVCFISEENRSQASQASSLSMQTVSVRSAVVRVLLPSVKITMALGVSTVATVAAEMR